MEINYRDSLANDELYDDHCPIIFALNIIGQKWKLPILWKLAQHQVLHYNELKRCVAGVTNTMLTKSLRELEHDGLIFRKQFETVPPTVEYGLTAKGESLLPTLNELYTWGKAQMPKC